MSPAPSRLRNRKVHGAPRLQQFESVAFTSVEEAWFWSLAAKLARDAGARPRAGQAAVPRPCEPLEVLHLGERLARRGEITRRQWAVMLAFGRRFTVPDPRLPRQRALAEDWRRGLAVLADALEAKGILAPEAAGEST